MLLIGDLVGAAAGVITRAPEPFTADAAAVEDSLRRVATLNVNRVLFSHGSEVADGPAALRALVESP